MFKNAQDKIFIDQLQPHPGEPVHNDLYSQIYDYVHTNYPTMSLSARGDYIRELLAYKEKIKCPLCGAVMLFTTTDDPSQVYYSCPNDCTIAYIKFDEIKYQLPFNYRPDITKKQEKLIAQLAMDLSEPVPYVTDKRYASQVIKELLEKKKYYEDYTVEDDPYRPDAYDCFYW